MSNEPQISDGAESSVSEKPLTPDPSVIAARIPIITRMAFDMPKPRNWQDFQRACAILYQAELEDPHAQEYGRQGQRQKGIDVLGRRGGRGDHYVGVQCRNVTNPLKQAKILSDCREALEIKAGLKEIVFATTAPDDTGATDAGIAVEKVLRADGNDVTVTVYGWGQLQNQIAKHPSAYAAFNPSALANTTPQSFGGDKTIDDLAGQLEKLTAMVQQSIAPAPRDPGASNSDEDPALHAKIDVLRDLFRNDHQPQLAEKRLRDLLADAPAETRPWARYRIETNLGAVALDLGREADAAEHFEAAYELRPEDGNAIANLALARTVQRRFDEAMKIARQSLETSPRSEHGIAYLLQAASRSDWAGDPETLIPEELRDSVGAAMGLAEYYRRKEFPDWPERSIEWSVAHPENEELKKSAALGVLELALRTDALLGGGHGLVSIEQISRAADDLKMLAERYIANGYAHKHDLLAFVSNAALLLRVAGRDAESEAILLKGIPLLPNEPSLLRVLALTQMTQNRPAEAIATLSETDDPESAILRAEMMTLSDPEAALEAALAVQLTTEGPKLIRMHWRMLADIALGVGRRDEVDRAVAALRAMPDNLSADIIEVRADLSADPGDENAIQRLLGLAQNLSENGEFVPRFEIARMLSHADHYDEAVTLLESHVDLNRPGPAALVYLQSLAGARRDKELEAALSRASEAVREDPEILWSRAAHAWNVGDLKRALELTNTLLTKQPENTRALLLKIEILIRSDQLAELAGELEAPIENLAWARLKDRFRVASLMAHFGQIDRAIAFSYRLFLEHRDTARAWMTLSSIVIEQGRSLEESRWDMPKVGADAAIDLEFEDSEKRFFVIEADPALRRIDPNSIEPDHSLALQLMGLAAGADFSDSNGRAGKVVQLRHKYVARFHYVLEHYNTRFPDEFGFQKVDFDLSGPDALAPIREKLEGRRAWAEQEEEQYSNGSWPLGLLAQRLGVDTIEAAAGLASAGDRLRVATGSHEDIARAEFEVKGNAQRGCVLDLGTFWTAWRLGALDAVVAACGPIRVPQRVADRLRVRRARFEESSTEGVKGAQLVDGRVQFIETPPEVIRAMRDDTVAAIQWLETNDAICPVEASDKLPDMLREHVRLGQSDVFENLVLAIETDRLLVCDDLLSRQLMGALVGSSGSWLQIVLKQALESDQIEPDDYIRWTASLINSGQSYLGVGGPILARAAALDHQAGVVPGSNFLAMAQSIGGAIAEPTSHIIACLTCLEIMWSDPAAVTYRERATGHLLRQLLRERTEDYPTILRTIVVATARARPIQRYVLDWMRGHFFPLVLLDPIAKAAQKVRKRRASKKY